MVLTSAKLLPLPKESFSNYYLPIIKGYGDKVALVNSNHGAFYTFKQVHDITIKLANSLTKMDLCKGDVIALCCANCLEQPMLILAAAELGLQVTTCNPRYTRDEMISQFVMLQPVLVITDRDRVKKLELVSKAISSIKKIVTLDKHQKYICLRDLINEDTRNKREYQPVTSCYDVNEAPFLLPFSSGTTGKPKVVLHTQATFTATILLWSDNICLPPKTILYCVLPMFHAFGIITALSTISQGSTLVIGTQFTVPESLATIEKNKITHFPVVPPMLLAYHKNKLLDDYDLSTLKCIYFSAAPLVKNVAVWIRKRLNVNLNQVYGMTEVAPVAGCLEAECPVDSVGRIGTNLQLKVVDVTSGEELGPNKNGEFRLKGPQVCKGYYWNEAFDAEGWFRTGDIGYYDDRGYIYIKSRLKELIKYKGFQVSPSELEEVIFGNPKVSDVGVIGVPDLEAGEVPKAFIVKKDDSLTAQEIHELLKGRLSTYKFLRGGIVFCEQIPKSSSGKILRNKLKEINSKL